MKYSEFIIFLLFIISCKKGNEVKIDCKKAQELAQSDFENGKFIFYEYQDLIQDTSANSELRDLLKENHILVKFKPKRLPSCIPADQFGIEYAKECYQTKMNYQLFAKFGHEFFDRLKIEAEKNSSNKNR